MDGILDLILPHPQLLSSLFYVLSWYYSLSCPLGFLLTFIIALNEKLVLPEHLAMKIWIYIWQIVQIFHISTKSHSAIAPFNTMCKEQITDLGLVIIFDGIILMLLSEDEALLYNKDDVLLERSE